MKRKTTSSIKRTMALFVALILAIGLFSTSALAAQTEDTDYIYSQSSDTVSTLGGTVTLTASLPAGTPFYAGRLSVSCVQLDNLGGSYDANWTAANPDTWSVNHGAYKGDSRYPGFAFNGVVGNTNVTYDEVTELATLQVTVPAGLTAGTVIEFFGNKDISIGRTNPSSSYFNALNSDYANDDRVIFTITVEDSTSVSGKNFDFVTGTALTLDDLMDENKGNVQITNPDGTPRDLTTADLDADEWDLLQDASEKGAVGTFPLTITVGDKQAEIAVTLWNHDSTDPDDPTDEDGAEDPADCGWIKGNDFTYQTGGADFLWSEIVDEANLVAQSANGVAYTTSVSNVNTEQWNVLNEAKRTEQIGPYHLVINNSQGADIDIIVTLKNTVVVDTTKGSISSNNFNEETGDPLLTAEDILTRGTVAGANANGIPYAVNTTNFTVNAVDLNTLRNAENNQQTGDYDVRVTNPLGAETIVTVTLIKTDVSALDVSSFSAITGTELTVNDIVTKGNATATNTDGTPHTLVEADLDANEWALIQEASKKGAIGSFPLTISVGSQEKQIEVTLWNHDSKDPDDPTDEDGPEDPSEMGEIMANDFTYETGGDPFTWDEFKTLSNMVGTNKYGYPLPLTSNIANAGQWKALNDAKTTGETGSFEVTVTIPDGADDTIIVTLKDHVITDEDSKATVDGDDFTEVTGGQPLTAAEVLDKANVGGKDKDGIPYDATDLDNFVVDLDDLNKLNAKKTNGEIGPCEVVITSPDGKTMTIVVDLEIGTTSVYKFDFNRDDIIDATDVAIAFDLARYVKSGATDEEIEFINYLFDVGYEDGTGDGLVDATDWSISFDQARYVATPYTIDIPNNLLGYYTSLNW